MVETMLAQDAAGFPIQGALRPSTSRTVDAVSERSTRTGTSFGVDTQVIHVLSAVPVFMALGGSTIEAATTDMMLAAGVDYRFSVGDRGNDAATHVAFCSLPGGPDGRVYITELI